MSEIIASVPVTSDEAMCSITLGDAYRPAFSSWINHPRLTYAVMFPPVERNGQKINDYFSKDDKRYIHTTIADIAKQVSSIIEKPIFEVSKDDPNVASFIISFEFLKNDGKGGKYALADFPPIAGQANTPRLIFDLADIWEPIHNRDKKQAIDFKAVATHEFGHIVGALQHDDCFCIMNSTRRYSGFQIDDVVGMKVQYRLFKNFKWEGKEYVWIDDRNENISNNFKYKEFLSKCAYSYDDGHFLNLQVINALQYIRSYYDRPIKILSTYRNISCNRAAKGASQSRHLFMDALDWKFVGREAPIVQREWEEDVIKQKGALPMILSLGIRGLGTYPYGYGTNHIDTRPKSYNSAGAVIANRRYGDTQYTVWGEFDKRGGYYDWDKEYKDND